MPSTVGVAKVLVVVGGRVVVGGDVVEGAVEAVASVVVTSSAVGSDPVEPPEHEAKSPIDTITAPTEFLSMNPPSDDWNNRAAHLSVRAL